MGKKSNMAIVGLNCKTMKDNFENQKEQIERFCKSERGYDLKGIYSESLSGKNRISPYKEAQDYVSYQRLLISEDRYNLDLHFTKLQKKELNS